MFKSAKNLILIVFILMAVLIVVDFALAVDPAVDVGLEYGEATGLAPTDPRTIAANIVRVVLAFLGIIAVVLIIYGGFLWMTAAGNEERISKAKKILISAIIGLIIILSAFAIASFILNKLLEVTGEPGPPPGPPIPPIPPIEINCDGISLTPECDPEDNICQLVDPDYYCNPDTCRCRRGGGEGDPCDDNEATPECEVNESLCASDYYCYSSTCRCRRRSDLLESCNATTTPGVCEPIPDRCYFDLTCDTSDCLCKDFPIIKGVSPVGGFCDDDQNMSCLSDADCVTTCNTDIPNAAIGNIITISGRYFGTTTGEVMFWDGSDFILLGTSPAALNPNCDSNWQDDQIIIVVPAGTQTGPIRVIRASDRESDDTNNDQGPMIEDLLINNIEKPGLCKLDPAEGRLGDSVSYYGINFSVPGSESRFGKYNAFIAGKNSSFLNDTNGMTDVPNIERGKISSFVAADTGEGSNYLKFRKLEEIAGGPYITSFEPEEGAIGQYVTIYGSGFGHTQGTNKVYFGDEVSGFEADYNFPDVCADSVWDDKQIIVKVPDDINDGSFAITIVLGFDIINTNGLATSTFRADNSLLLSPCLCKISPVMGQAGGLISLWGEYFDLFDANSKVRFYSNRDMSGAGISFWDLDPENQGEIDVYKAETTIHPETVTGPVRVVKASPEQVGNGINFAVGNCLEAVSPDEACGIDICCPADTYKAGRCAASLNDCSVDIPASVYEWDFSTTPATTTLPSDFDSCIEMSIETGACIATTCPNSAGQCSFYSGGEQEIVGDCDYSCQTEDCGTIECFDNIPTTTCSWFCSYNNNLDRCTDNRQASCSLPASTKDVYGKDTTMYCEKYGTTTDRRIIYISTNISCPNGWTKIFSLGGKKVSACVDLNSSCVACVDNFVCLDDGDEDGEGLCGIPRDICPDNSICEDDNKCRRIEQLSCECCCGLANQNQDCCSPLECLGDCGSDRDEDEDEDKYGYCSGCRTDLDGNDIIDADEQALSDEKCICSGSRGKYCDVDVDIDGDGEPEGICRDCGQLFNEASCSAHHTTCCVDAMDDNDCRGRVEDSDIVSKNEVAYCGYYQCIDNNTACDNNPVATTSTSTAKYFDTIISCKEKCKKPPELGRSCTSRATSSFATTTTCDTSICLDPFDCINEKGTTTSPTGYGCGYCCCDPDKDPDPCKTLNLDLICQKDKEPCTGNKRGLCCGCVENDDCGNINEVGCGNDACCRARPNASSTIPADGEYEICTNAEIRIEFDQKMNVNSFSGNIIVVGEYSGVCPEGTIYLARAGAGWEDKNIIVRTFYKIINFFREPFRKVLGKRVFASPPPVATMNYCAITGSVGSEHVGKNGTILRFLPQGLLDTDRKYYVIVRGDVSLNNQTGVLNYWEIGMNALASPVDNTSAFNGITYANAYIWSFTTLPDQDGDDGVCEIDHVTVFPSSYLFQTVINDLNENDSDPNNKSFDTVRDRDKKFTAYAISLSEQILAPVAGYSWIWNWDIEDSSVARINSTPFDPSGEDKESQLIEADPGVTDKKTILSAEVELIESTYSTVGDGETGEADIYIFVCENPWPSIRSSGNWYPWSDNNANCLPGTGTCFNTNYLLYYCRDQGEFGTVDDLPAILSDAITRGATNELLKESYFFREEAPEIEDVNLQATALAEGEAIEFDWSEITDPEGIETVNSYKLYYDTDSGVPYSDYVEIIAEDAPYVLGNSLFRLEGLENNTTYYFAITAIYESGAESDYSNEVSVYVDDIEAPGIPAGLEASIVATTTIFASWQANTDDTVGYRLYYGHASDVYGSRIPVSESELILDTSASFGINLEQEAYYLVVAAVDEEGNESDKSQEVVVSVD